MQRISSLRVKGLIYLFGVVSGVIIGFLILSVHHPHGGSSSRSLNHDESAENTDEDLDSIVSKHQRIKHASASGQDKEEEHDHGDHDHDDHDHGGHAKPGKGEHVPAKGIHFADEGHHAHDQSEVADELAKKVRVLCWVMTSPENHKTRAVHVLATWGKRCNKILFVSEQDDKTLPIIKIDVKFGREHLTAKTMGAFDHIYEHHRNEADWFLKADDDTYVVVENLRYFLSSHSPNESIYFGHHFKTIVKQGYFSGGGGYALSSEALRRFAARPKGQCASDQGAEDAEFGKCMESLGVKTGDSRDNLGRSRFHCFNPETHVHGGYPDWYLVYDKYGAKKGIESISDYAITFHYVSVEQLYNLEFYIYHLRPYGIVSGLQDLNRSPDDGEDVIGTNSTEPSNVLEKAQDALLAKEPAKPGTDVDILNAARAKIATLRARKSNAVRIK